MEEKPNLYWYTNYQKITPVTNEIEIVHDTENERFCAVHWFDLIRDSSMLRNWNTVGGKIRKKFRYVFIRLASVEYVFYISLHKFITCGRSVKEKVFSFISYCILFFITPQSLAPIFSCSPITCSLIFCSPITRSATLTLRSLFPPNNSHPVPSLLLSNLIPGCLIALPPIFEN